MIIMRIVAGFICAFLLLSGYVSPAFAARKSKPASEVKVTHRFSLTPTAGEYVFDRKDNVKSGRIYSLKASYDITGADMMNSLGIDVIAGLIDTTSTVDGSKVKVYHFRADAIYPFIFKNSKFVPFLSVGAGSNLFEKSTDTDVVALVSYGAGVKYRLLDYLAARADVRHILVVKPERRDNLEFTAGLTYTFGVERKPKPPVDSDKDGVPDNLDKCAGTPPGTKVDKDGCPKDSDGDGVPDYLDSCFGTPRKVKVDKQGCPEATAKVQEPAKPDEGGVSAGRGEPIATPGQQEAIPRQEGAIPTGGGVAVTAIAGAGDGLEIRTNAPVENFEYFRESKPERLVINLPGATNAIGSNVVSVGTPGIAGGRVETFNGKLRIVFEADRETFPQVRVEKTGSGLKVSFTEPAAKDGAGVSARDVEKAPAPAAPPAPAAAPAPREKEQAEPGYLLKFNVEFDFNKSNIRPIYYGMLREAAAILKSNPGTVAEIIGHTDSIGKAHYNMLLSKRRADSVRRYLVKKSGVDSSRIVISGYGFYRPVADNRTAEGRQKNRRTEVTIVIRKSGEPGGRNRRGNSAPGRR